MTQWLATPWAHRIAAKLVDIGVVAWLFLCTSAVFPLLAMGAAGGLSDETNARLRLLLLPGLFLAPFLTVARAREIGWLLLRHPALPLLLAWTWLSVAWSIDPGLSGRRALSLTTNTLNACFLVVAYDLDALLRRLLWVALAVLALSVAFGILAPGLAFMPDVGAFRGVFTHKNGMGLHLVLVVLLTLVARWRGIVGPKFTLIVLATALALALPTASSTAVMMLAVLVALHLPLIVARMPRRLATLGLALLAIAALGLALPLLLARNRIFLALGRDPSLTGRIELWSFVRDLIDQRPLLGYGYGAMFEDAGVKEHVLALLGWGAPNAHNGYLEVWLGLGLVGLGLVVLFLTIGWGRALRLAIVDPNAATARFAFLYLSLYLLRSFSESNLLAQSDLSWVLAVLAVLGLHGEVRRGARDPGPTALPLTAPSRVMA